MLKIIKNPSEEDFLEVMNDVKDNDGYCPCLPKRSEDTKCMCKEFKEKKTEGMCRCGLYKKVLKD